MALFGEAVPRAPASFKRTAWGTDPLARGAYAYDAVRNNAETWEEIGLPVGGWLWFTGEHLAPGRAGGHRNQGTVHGAFSAGRQVALQLLSLTRDAGIEDGATRIDFAYTGGSYAHTAVAPRFGCKDYPSFKESRAMVRPRPPTLS